MVEHSTADREVLSSSLSAPFAKAGVLLSYSFNRQKSVGNLSSFQNDEICWDCFIKIKQITFS